VALQALHPSSPWRVDQEEYVPYSPPQVISVEDVMGSIRSSKYGKSGGVTGWLLGHFKYLLKIDNQEEISLLLNRVFNLIVSGRMPPSARGVLFASRLVTSPKDGGGVRPIAMGGTLPKLVEKSIMRSLAGSGEVDRIFPHLQFGVGKPLGVDQVCHSARRLVKEGHHLLSVDVRNAFNTVSRASLFNSIVNCIPSLTAYYLLSYGSPTPLMVVTTSGTREISSEEGVRQGAPLSSLFFCLAIQDVLQHIVTSHPSVSVSCYADDMNFGGKSLNELDIIYSELEAELGHRSLVLRPDKSKLLLHHPETEEDSFNVEGVCKMEDGIIVCGTPIGGDDFVVQFLRDKMGEMDDVMTKLMVYRDQGPSPLTIEAFYLFRTCVTTSVGHLMRTLPPQAVGVTEFFECLKDRFGEWGGAVLGVDPLVGDPLTIFTLPVGDGGFGIIDPAKTHCAAYFSSIVECNVRYGGEEWGEVMGLVEPLGLKEIVMEKDEFFNDEKPGEVRRGIQKLLTRRITSSVVEELMGDMSSLDGVGKARVLGGGGGKGSSWIFVRGDDMRQQEFSINAALRLGIPLPNGLHEDFLSNFSSNFSDPAQLLGLSNGGGIIARHNRMEDILLPFLRKCRYSAWKEPMFRTSDGAGRRADLMIQGLDLKKPLFVDFSFVNTTMRSYLGSSDALATRRKEKLKKYEADVLEVGGTLVPLVLDVNGRIDSCFVASIKDLLGDESRKFWKVLGVQTARMRAWTLVRLIDGFRCDDSGKVVERLREL